MSEEATNWVESLPEELRDAPFLEGAETPADFKERIANAAQYMGNSVRIPGPDAGDDDIAAFQAKVMEKIPGLMVTPNAEDPESLAATMVKLGKPEAADAYKTPEGVALPAEEVGRLKALAHDANMTQSQFDAYLSGVNKLSTEGREAAERQLEEGTNALKGEWGAAFDERTQDVAKFLEKNTSTPAYILESLKEGKLPADQVRWLHSLAETINIDDGGFSAQEDTRERTLTPSEAESQLNEVEARIFSQTNPPTPQEMQSLTEKRMKLMAQAYPQ